MADIGKILPHRPNSAGKAHHRQHRPRTVFRLPPPRPQQDAASQTERQLHGSGYESVLEHPAKLQNSANFSKCRLYTFLTHERYFDVDKRFKRI